MLSSWNCSSHSGASILLHLWPQPTSTFLTPIYFLFLRPSTILNLILSLYHGHMTMFVSQTYTLLGWVCLHTGTAVFSTEGFSMYVLFCFIHVRRNSFAQMSHTPTCLYRAGEQRGLMAEWAKAENTNNVYMLRWKCDIIKLHCKCNGNLKQESSHQRPLLWL